MNQRIYPLIKFLLDLADIPVIYAGLLLSYFLRFHSGLFDVSKGIPRIGMYERSFLAIAIAWHLLFRLEGIYRMRGRLTVEQFVRVLKTILLASVLLLALVFFIRSFEYSRLTVVLGLVVTTGLVGLFHVFKRLLFTRMHRAGLGVRRALLVGDGAPLTTVHEKLARSRALGLQLVGVLSDQELALEGCPRLGGIDKIRDVLMEQRVEDVFVAMSEYSPKRVMALIQSADMAGVTFRIIPDVYSLIASSVQLGEMAGLPLINVGLLPIHGFQGTLKHGLDFVASGLGLLFLSPFLALVAAAIRFESRGPVIYRQERVGLDGRTFTIFKFRSMRVDAEASTGPIWAQPGDPRRTRIGEFIRKYSIDELPQLYNVFRGDMSLVGPRPERPHFVNQFRAEIPDYMMRHRVRTGITGWAQINGLRGQSSIEDRTKYDIWYIENWSFLLDLEILLKTVWVCIFKPEGY